MWKEIEAQAVLVVKAYDTNALLDCIAGKNVKTVIPPKANRKEQREFGELLPIGSLSLYMVSK